MLETLLPDLLTIVGPLLIAAVTYYATEWLTRYAAWVDALSPHLKRGVVLAIASAITLVASRLSVELPTDLARWDPSTIDALVSAILAMSVKAGNTAKAAKAEAHDAKQAIG